MLRENQVSDCSFPIRLITIARHYQSLKQFLGFIKKNLKFARKTDLIEGNLIRNLQMVRKFPGVSTKTGNR